jgi:hypothetical protein
LLGTEFLEHFFGLARMLLPNFTFAEFWKMVQHIMVRYQILSSGKFEKKKERTSAVGYIMDFDTNHITTKDRLHPVTLSDHDIRLLIEIAHSEAVRICKDILNLPTPSLPFQLKALGVQLPRKKKAVTPTDADNDSDGTEDSDGDVSEDDDDDDSDKAIADGMQVDDLSPLAADAAEHSARYSALCEDYDKIIAEVTAQTSLTSSAPTDHSLAANQAVSAPEKPAPSDVQLTKSLILDDSGKASIALMLRERERLQGGTTAKSERVVRIDPKFALKKVVGPNGEPVVTAKEASHLVRITQSLDSTTKTATKTRILRWQATCQKIRGLVESKRESLLRHLAVFELIAAIQRASQSWR